MNRRHLIRLVLAAFLAGAAPTLLAQQSLEIIPLRHRTVDQVLPALQPLLEPGGTLSGSRGQLILRASPGNAADIKRALAAIDQPSRRLQISVRLDDAGERERRDVRASGSIGSGGVRFSGSAQDAHSASAERIDQRVQVLEGGRAWISTGQSRPLRSPGGTTTIQDIATGFEVVPHVSGGGVVLDVAQQREAPGAQPGRVQGQRMATQVRARFGEWVEIGGTAQAGVRDERGIGVASGGRASESRRVWIKVEELTN